MSLCISIVSHGQNHLVNPLLLDLAVLGLPMQVVLTHNVFDPTPLSPQALASPQLHITQLHNRQPMGFGANHNQAFGHCTSHTFVVCNPDIRLQGNPFASLHQALEDPSIGVAAPLVLAPNGQPDDSAREFPTLASLVRKALGGHDGRQLPQGLTSSANTQTATPVDWVAGMFLAFRPSVFKALGGFDERFHLYYEDVDLCARLWQQGYQVVVCPSALVVHHAQRASRRHWQYRLWHAASLVRYLLRYAFSHPKKA